jgi:pimeloyl-ACP methyl ester carboxylesterase
LMPVFERDGLAFHYLDEGDPSGRPFVFQHGLGGDVSQPAGVFSPPPGIRLLSLDCVVAMGRRIPWAACRSSLSRLSPTTSRC